MDRSSRVNNIKQKFEDNDNTFKVKSANHKTLFNNFNMIEQRFLNCNEHCLINNSGVNSSAFHRTNIKRTPAFRREKVAIRNVEKDDGENVPECSIVTNRINQFNKLQHPADSKLLQVFESENNLSVSDEKLNDCKSETENKFETIHSSNSKDNLKIKKPIRNTKKIVVNKKSYIDNITRNSITGQNSVGYRKNSKQKSGLVGIRSESKTNKENKQSTKNNDILFGSKNEELSDTLERILRFPLPTGPPPKKPPRTFCGAKSASNTINETNKFVGCTKENNTSTENNKKYLVETIQPLVRSKTESEIKLKKIEHALLKHQQKYSHPPTLNNKKKFNSSTDLNCTNKFTIKNKNQQENLKTNSCNSNSLQLTHLENKLHISRPVQRNLSKVTNFQNEDASCHIYEVPNQSNINILLPGEKTVNSSLYYMSTPIDPFLNSSECIMLNGITNNQKSDVKISESNDGSPSPDNISMEKKIKMWMNEAYSEPMTKVSDSSDSDSVVSVNQSAKPEKQSDTVDGYSQVTLERKGYVQKVASRAVSWRHSILTQSQIDYKYLFECLFLIGLDLDSCNNKVPYIKMMHPKNVEVPQWTEHICFPDAHDWFRNSSETIVTRDDKADRCFVVYLTTKTGQRKYVYCRRIKPEGEECYLPLSYCILSSHRSSYFYFSILEQIETRHGQSEIEFNKFMKQLHNNKFPAKGQGIKIDTYSEDGKQTIVKEIVKRSLDSRLEDLQLAKALSILKINTFIYIFSSMLLERKIILLSSSLSKLSTCIEGLQTALLPFQWHHTLITMVPSTIIPVRDLCEAPTPYLIGLCKSKSNSDILPPSSEMQQLLIVDLDANKILHRVGDENSILPTRLAKGIKNALRLAHSSEISTNNLLACEAFTRLFVELIGHYRQFIVPDENDLGQKKLFQKKQFLNEPSIHSVKMFLEWFVETAAFSAFIETRLSTNSESDGLFEQRCHEYFTELNRLKYTKGNKINKTVRQIGDMLKDLI